MNIESRNISYTLDGQIFEGFFAAPGGEHLLPCVLICHTWAGRDEFACNKVMELAELGYAAFAVDLYGGAKVGAGPTENSQLMGPLMADRRLLLQRLMSGLDAARAQPEVDTEKLAAIGFCFGGLCVLDLARSGTTQIRGVVSFHGLLHPPPQPPAAIAAKILLLHGYDDPLAPPDQLQSVAAELSAAGADWQIHVYGRTAHAFTNPRANDIPSGLVYSAAAHQRAWMSMRNYLEEVLK